MDKFSDDEVAETWIAYTHAACSLCPDSIKIDQAFWAARIMMELPAADPQRTLCVILLIIRIDASDVILRNLAAGPLEDLLSYSGSEIIDKVERIANDDLIFRDLLAGVWPREGSSDVWARVAAASKGANW